MVSSGVVALFVVVVAQVAQAIYLPPNCACQCTDPKPQFEEGCCPGPVIEKKYITQKAINVPYSYSVPTFSKKCYKKESVDKKVIPYSWETDKCDTLETVVKVPTTDVEINQQPLCKKTCTTSEYLIQIPIVETTCTRSPLCKKTVKTQNNLLTTTASKVSCAKQFCTNQKVVETPVTQTVCQDYQGSINKVGSKTVLKPEVKKTCVQLPPYKCLKPASPSPDFPYYPGSPIVAPPADLPYYPGAPDLPYYPGAPVIPSYPGVPAVPSDYLPPSAPLPPFYPGAYPGAYPGVLPPDYVAPPVVEAPPVYVDPIYPTPGYPGPVPLPVPIPAPGPLPCPCA